MFDSNTRQLIGAALSGCCHSSWVAAVSDGQGGIVEIIWENRRNPEELEVAVRAEHDLLIRDAGRVFVARSRASLGQYAHGVTLVCRHDSGWRLLVMVIRSEALGRFTEAELEVLAESASVIAASMAPSCEAIASHAHTSLRSRDQPAFSVVNLRHEVELSWTPESMQQLESLWPSVPRLPPLVEAAVRDLTSSWSADDPSTLGPGVAVPRPTMVVRTVPLSGPGGLRIGVIVEQLKTRTIGSAAREYGLSPRELDVLALLLEGRTTGEVAKMLHIAPSTATHYVKRMLLKTGSRNRAELIARALGWRSGRPSASV
jgi:DNA-binding CsgD family transcriptional regulator